MTALADELSAFHITTPPAAVMPIATDSDSESTSFASVVSSSMSSGDSFATAQEEDDKEEEDVVYVRGIQPSLEDSQVGNAFWTSLRL